MDSLINNTQPSKIAAYIKALETSTGLQPDETVALQRFITSLTNLIGTQNPPTGLYELISNPKMADDQNYQAQISSMVVQLSHEYTYTENTLTQHGFDGILFSNITNNLENNVLGFALPNSLYTFQEAAFSGNIGSFLEAFAKDPTFLEDNIIGVMQNTTDACQALIKPK